MALDSPRREPVPAFGGWSLEEPNSLDYSEIFTKARVSRLGSMPPDKLYEEEYFSQPDAMPNASTTTTMARQSSKRIFFHFFVCGARTQTVA